MASDPQKPLIPAEKESKALVSQACLIVLTLIALGTVLYLMRSIAIPLTIAVLLSFIVVPSAITLNKKLYIPRFLANVLILLFLGLILFLFLQFIVDSGQSLIDKFSLYREQLSIIFSDIVISYNLPKEFLKGIAFSQQSIDKILSAGIPLLQQTVSISTQLLLILLCLAFILFDDPLSFVKIRKSFSMRTTLLLMRTFRNVAQQINRYLITKLVVSLLTGLSYYIILKVIHLELALMWGILAFLLNFIPTFGSIIVTFLISLIALIQFYPNLTSLGAVILAMVGVQTILGNIVEPIFQGMQLKLSPMMILVSLIFWGWLWGPMGMILAVPLTEIVKIVMRNIPFLKSVARLMEQVNPSPFKAVNQFIFKKRWSKK